MKVSSQLHAAAALPPGRLDGHQNRSGRCGQEKNLPPGIEPQLLGTPARSLVAIPTELVELYNCCISCRDSVVWNEMKMIVNIEWEEIQKEAVSVCSNILSLHLPGRNDKNHENHQLHRRSYSPLFLVALLTL
jgi:hypothetical protein